MYFQDHVINNNVIERSFNNGCKIWMHKDVKYVENIIKCTFGLKQNQAHVMTATTC